MAGLGNQGLRMIQQAFEDADEEGLLSSDMLVGGKIPLYSPPREFIPAKKVGKHRNPSETNDKFPT